MKTFFKKRIVDERMELQSLRNARKSWNFLLLASGLSLLAEVNLFNWELKYIVPQAVIIFAASVYNLFLDIRDGNVYTAESANRKKIFLLYGISSFIAALIISFGAYYRFSLAAGILTFILLFFLMFGFMYMVDSLCFCMGKKRIMKDSEDED